MLKKITYLLIGTLAIVTPILLSSSKGKTHSRETVQDEKAPPVDSTKFHGW